MKLNDYPPLNEARESTCPICKSTSCIAYSTPVCHGCITEILGKKSAESFLDKFKSGFEDAEYERKKEKIEHYLSMANGETNNEPTEQKTLT